MDSEFGPVIDRLKAELGLHTDKDVAEALGMKPSTFGERRKRGTLPFEELIPLADSRNVDLRWLLTGKGENAQSSHRVESSAGIYHVPVDVDLLATVIAGARAALRDRGVELLPAKEAKVIAWLYEHFKAKGHADSAAFARFLDVVVDS